MIYLGKRLSASLFVILTVFIACQSATPTAPSPDEPVKLSTQQSSRLASGLDIKLDSIVDTRCPSNATCAWQGNVAVTAILTKGETKRLWLRRGPDPIRENRTDGNVASVVLGGETYKLTLREVTPYPGNGTGVKQADILVSRP